MKRSLKTIGLILKRQDFGEADRLLTIFSYDKGKLKAIAKGVRKPLSKMAGHLEPFSMTSFQLSEGRNFYTVTGADLQEAFADIRTNLGKTSVALYFLEAVDALTVDNEPHWSAFQLTIDTLAILEAMPGIQKRRVLTVGFSLKLLAELGYLPELQSCVSCTKVLVPEKIVFSSSFGGLLCEDCQRLDYAAIKLSTNSVKAMRILIAEPVGMASRLGLSDAVLDELEQVAQQFLQHHTEREMRTSGFVRDMAAD